MATEKEKEQLEFERKYRELRKALAEQDGLTPDIILGTNELDEDPRQAGREKEKGKK